jgi:hypothetical protein
MTVAGALVVRYFGLRLGVRHDMQSVSAGELVRAAESNAAAVKQPGDARR